MHPQPSWFLGAAAWQTCRVYHRLESLTEADDEEIVSQAFLGLLGRERLQFLQLVHQLIVAEELLLAGAA
jgi:hypothetical protein